MQPSGGKTRPVFGNLCLQRETVPSTWITRLGMSLLKKYKTILLFFSSSFFEKDGCIRSYAPSHPCISDIFLLLPICFLEPSSHFPHKVFVDHKCTINIPPSIPLRAPGRSYLFAIDHGGVAHMLESCRWGEAPFAIKQWGAVWNLRKRQLPPPPPPPPHARGLGIRWWGSLL